MLALKFTIIINILKDDVQFTIIINCREENMLYNTYESHRVAFKVHWNSGVGFYCKNIGAKIVYGVKIAL